jgi:hypothetical protein
MMDGEMNRRMDKWTNGQMDKWTNGQMDVDDFFQQSF